MRIFLGLAWHRKIRSLRFALAILGALPENAAEFLAPVGTFLRLCA
jgi:hypothetical protein